MGTSTIMRNKMRIIFVVFLLAIMLLSAGCISNYKFLAEGKCNFFGIRDYDAYVSIDNVMYTGYTLSTILWTGSGSY